MNAAPPIVGADSGGNLSGANAASGKSSALPGFGQILAAKQAPASARQSDTAAVRQATRTQRDTQAPGQTNGPATSKPANEAAYDNTGTPALAPKKGDGKVAGSRNSGSSPVATNGASLLPAINLLSPVPLQAEPEAARTKSEVPQGEATPQF